MNVQNSNSRNSVDETEDSLVPPVDFEMLLKRAMGNIEFMFILLADFEESGLRQVDEIALLSANDDWDAVAEVAHSLKGATSLIGANRVSQLAAEIERAGRAAQGENLFSLITTLRREVEQCYEQIAEFRLQSQPPER